VPSRVLIARGFYALGASMLKGRGGSERALVTLDRQTLNVDLGSEDDLRALADQALNDMLSNESA
jgi:hypothetical protein